MGLKQRWRDVRPYVISGLVYGVARAVGATLRVRTLGFPQSDSKCIFCGWHGQSMVFANYFRNRGYWVIISQSKDGDMQNTIFSRFGYKTIRGSTGRGGARAAIEAIRVLRDGGTMAMTPDGPRGPSGIVQGGVMLMAQRGGGLLIPVGISARPRWLAKSWDRYMIPWPFAKAVLIFGEALTVDEDASEAEVEQVRRQLESEIHRLQAEADGAMGVGPTKRQPVAAKEPDLQGTQ